MDIKANELYRSILKTSKVDLAETDIDSRSKALVDFLNFALADTASEAAAAVKDILNVEVPAWDEDWVISEAARSTLDGLDSFLSVATAVLERLERSSETESTEELRRRLEEVLDRRTAHA
jgi:hypothetical protein